MKQRNAALNAFAAGCVMAALHSASHAADSASFEFATGNKTQMARIATQWKWGRQWKRSHGVHIGGYWDASLAHWRGRRHQNIEGRSQHITSIGITPVFRIQHDTLKGFYAEAGIGAHYLSGKYDNNGDELSTNFQFGDHIGMGYIFQNNLDLGLKLQHFSNGGIKDPNDGVNFAVVRISYPF
jgi:lipid A 3-O-deacylase